MPVVATRPRLWGIIIILLPATQRAALTFALHTTHTAKNIELTLPV